MKLSLIALKNADHLLSEVLKTVDTDGDGYIQYNGQSMNWMAGLRGRH